ncbi:putative portal protein [Pseudomonas phage OBP]|uniref:virion structural protein n=1 Tax=Pseudomonas phage OBP TaxID=1124849 RepID=UPI000240D559|nr:virion structural protein [Pseudomonas phage OBP]AEV89569.1 putative portal protein [Pseudomonas phage OBP]
MSSTLPKGIKPTDRTQVRGRLNNPSPLDKSMRSLLVKDKNIRDEKDAENKTKPPVAKVKNLSDIISNNIQASVDLRTITHYIKRAEQIWTTLLLKPNGDQRQLFIYDTEQSDIKNAKLHDMLIQKVENYFTTKYPVEELAPQIIKDVLFRTGSYAHVSLSHSVLDHLINGMEVDGSESFKSQAEAVLAKHFTGNSWDRAKNLGYIRKTRETKGSFVGFESIYNPSSNREAEYNIVDDRLKWTFTDNPLVLKVGELAQRMRADRLQKMAGLEDMDSAIRSVFRKDPRKRHKVNNNHINAVSKKTLEEEIKGLYPDREYELNESTSVRKGKFYSGNGRGVGISYHWPSEGCIPVHVNGEIGKPFGFILLTDPETGEPLKNTSDVKFYQKAKGAGEATQPKMGSINEIVNHIRTVAEGKECNEDMAWMAEFSSATLEKELIEGFLNGDLHKDVSISLTEENKKLYLGRALRDQGVRAIFVPAEYVTYVAIDFSRLGVGRSLVDEAKLHITRLAVLDTADALAQVENSISHTLLEITPEEEDFDIRNTIAMIRDEYFSANPTLHDILGYNNVSIDAVLDRFKEQSVTVKVNPSDNKYAITPDITARQMERESLKGIDPSLRENLLNTISGFFGLKRSWLEDTGDGNDFAIEALADQELLRNQTTDYSRTFSRGFTDIMRKHMRVNEPLIAELVEVIRENKSLYEKPDQTGALEVKEEAAEKINNNGAEEVEVEDMEAIELVLKDFLNSFFVTLPTPAITDSLLKLEDKIEAVEKLVEVWTTMGGGVEMLQKRAEEIGLDGENIIGTMKGVLLTEAFERYNLPMPFEQILSNGNAGGMLTYISRVTDLDLNVVKFLTEWHKGTKKGDVKAEKLKDKIEKENNDSLNSLEPQEQSFLTNENGDGLVPQKPSDDMFNENLDAEQPGNETIVENFNDDGTPKEEGVEQVQTDNGLGDDLKGGGDDLWTS